MWLDREMAWQAAASGKPGRPATYSDTAVQCCLTMKVLFGLALRQTQGFVQSVLGLSGLDWQAPDYSTMSRREKRLTVEITARPSRGGLHLLVDSTGIKMLGEGEWKTKKHGAEYRRQWRRGPSGDRRRNAGDPGDRGDGQRRGGCTDAAGAARADSGR